MALINLAALQRADVIVRTALYERFAMKSNVFGEATRGAFTISPGEAMGPGKVTTEIEQLDHTTIVRQRDLTSQTALAQKNITEKKKRSVQLARTTDAFTMQEGDFDWEGRPEQKDVFWESIAEQVADAMTYDHMIAGVTAAIACLLKTSPESNTWLYDITGNTDPQLSRYAEDLAMRERLGEFRNELVAKILTPNGSQQLEESLVTDGAGTIVASDALRGIGYDRHGIATFETSLSTLDASAGPPATVYALYLKANAVRARITNAPRMYIQREDMVENPLVQVRWKWDWELDINGFSYDLTAGGENPDLAALGTGANWDHFLNQDKNLPGYVIEHEGGYRAKA